MGTYRTLDGCKGYSQINNKGDVYEQGVLSRDGWAVVDESDRHVLEKDGSIPSLGSLMSILAEKAAEDEAVVRTIRKSGRSLGISTDAFTRNFRQTTRIYPAARARQRNTLRTIGFQN